MQPKPLFSLFGVPIFVEPPFWLMAVVFGFLAHPGNPRAIFLWVPIMFSAILFHELGHALTARLFGLQSFVVFQSVGFGLTVYGNRAGQPNSAKPWQIILITLVGPLVGIFIGALAAWYSRVAGPMSPTMALALRDIIFTNFIWALFNLIPVFPLDGGMIVLVALERFFGMRGVIAARYIFIGVAVLAVALFVGGKLTGRAELMPAMIFGFFAIDNYRRLREEERWKDKVQNRGAPKATATRVSVAESGTKAAPTVQEALAQGYENLERAMPEIGTEKGRQLADEVAEVAECALTQKVDDNDLYELLHLAAWGHLLAGRAELAEKALAQLPPGTTSDALLAGATELELGRPAPATKLLAEALRQKNDDFVSARLARAVALSRDVSNVESLFTSDHKALGARPLQIIVHDLFHAGLYAESARLGTKLFELHRQGEDAFNVACALSRANQFTDAVEWLHRAIEAGLKDPSLVETDADLAPLRSRPEFEAIRTRLP